MASMLVRGFVGLLLLTLGLPATGRADDVCGNLNQPCCPVSHALGCAPNLACSSSLNDVCVPAKCWACACLTEEGGEATLCSTTLITVSACPPCPPGTISAVARAQDPCSALEVCAGKTVTAKQPAPALSPLGLAGLVMLFLGVGVLGLVRKIT